jgi:hypothetical protein
MQNGSTAACVAQYHAPDVEDNKTGRRLQSIPWVRIIVDTLLVAGILLASSSFLSVR